jgi:hypothetical protein
MPYHQDVPVEESAEVRAPSLRSIKARNRALKRNLRRAQAKQDAMIRLEVENRSLQASLDRVHQGMSLTDFEYAVRNWRPPHKVQR